MMQHKISPQYRYMAPVRCHICPRQNTYSYLCSIFPSPTVRHRHAFSWSHIMTSSAPHSLPVAHMHFVPPSPHLKCVSFTIATCTAACSFSSLNPWGTGYMYPRCLMDIECTWTVRRCLRALSLCRCSWFTMLAQFKQHTLCSMLYTRIQIA